MRQAALYVKVLIVPVILWVMFSSLLSEENLTGFEQGYAMVFASVLLNQLGLAAYSFRLGILSAVYGAVIGRMESFKIHLQSVFYQVFIPMTVGMELARFMKIRAIHPEVTKRRLLLALLSDRAWSFVAALMTSLALAPMFISRFAGHIEKGYVLWGTVAMLLVAGLAWMHPFVRALVVRVWRAVTEQGREAGWLLLWTFVAHLSTLTAVYLLLQALNVNVMLYECLFGISASMLLLVIPVSVLGVTLSEGGIMVIFSLLGYSVEQAALVASSNYALRIVAALQGGIWEFVEDGYRIKILVKKEV